MHEVYPFAVTNPSQLLWLDPPSSHGWMVQDSLPRLFTQFRWEQTAYARHSKVQVLQLRPGKAAGASHVTFVADSTWLVLCGGVSSGVCRDCKRGVTFMGSAVAIFFAIVGGLGIVYALAGMSN